MKENFDIKEIREFIEKTSINTKIYLGCDSVVKKNKKVIKYACAIVVHFDGCKGAKVFGKIDTEKIIIENKGKPFNRMMREVEKITEIYKELEDLLIEREFEIHIDVNSSEKFGSNVALGAALGYVKYTIGVDPIFKPYAFAASKAADKLCKI